MVVYPMRDDPRHNCMCGIHVETGALIIAILGSISFALLALAARFPLTIYYVLLTAIHLSILIGHKQRVAAWYMPFLVYQFIRNVILTLICGLMILVVLITGAVEINHSESNSIRSIKDLLKYSMNVTGREDYSIPVEVGVLVMLILVFILVIALNYWVFSVVARARRYVKEEQDWKAQNIAPPATGLATNVIW